MFYTLYNILKNTHFIINKLDRNVYNAIINFVNQNI